MTKELIQQISAVRSRLAADGPSESRQVRDNDYAFVSVPFRDCDVVRDLLIREKAHTVIEIGLAYGNSALAIGEALVTNAGPGSHHLIIDPAQTAVWNNAGCKVLMAAGLSSISTLLEEQSQVALPRLLADGTRADAAFVDGDHKFHSIFVDLYYLGKIVRPGGLIVVDDLCLPSVRSAAHYFELNLGWSPSDAPFTDGSFCRSKGTGRLLAYRLPDRPIKSPWNHFVPF